MGQGLVKVEAASDEFESASLDRTKWRTCTGYESITCDKDEDGQCRKDADGNNIVTKFKFEDANVTVSGGNARLAAKKRPNGTGNEWGAAVLEYKFDIPGQPSYVEVRAKVLSREANVLSAIWLQSFSLSEANNPNPEIDIIETFNYSKMKSTLLTWTSTPSDANPATLKSVPATLHSVTSDTGVPDISKGYHTYGLERRDGWLRFYFDNKLVSVSRPNPAEMTTLPRHLILSLESHLGVPNAEFLPATFDIDWVRTYRYTG